MSVTGVMWLYLWMVTLEHEAVEHAVDLGIVDTSEPVGRANTGPRKVRGDRQRTAARFRYCERASPTQPTSRTSKNGALCQNMALNDESLRFAAADLHHEVA